MNRFDRSGLSTRKKLLLWAVLSYAFLLVMSYGFPVTGDDWWFAPTLGKTYTLKMPVEKGTLHRTLTHGQRDTSPVTKI